MRNKFSSLFVLAALTASMAIMGISAASAIAAETGEPTVMTESASGVSRTSATLNALVNPNGSTVSECEFEYGTSPTALTGSVPCAQLPGSGENDVTVSAALEGLAESQTYYFRVVATNPYGTQAGGTKQFTTIPNEPKGHSESASLVTKTTAQFNAEINPDGATVEKCEFEYGTTMSYGTKVKCAVLPGSGERLVPVYASVSSLSEKTKYYYRVVAKNSFGEFFSGPESFTTFPFKPKAVTQGTASVTESSATPSAAVNPDDSEVTSCEFEYGTSQAFGSHAACTSLPPGEGENAEPVSASLTGLSASTNYYYRIVATNVWGSSFGQSKRFTTLPSKPKAQSKPASEITPTSALFNGTVNPEDSLVTSCKFEWGLTQAYGSVVACASLPGSGSSAVEVSAAIGGLSENTTYNYRVVATNGFGSGYGNNQQFKTEVVGLLPTVTGVSPKKGPETGETLVTIKGTNFTGVEKVEFGPNEATEVTFLGTNEITAKSPPGVGSVSITVTTPNGTSAVAKKGKFKYKKVKG
jgi:phosphodiesterase/alkaline phosphatase D-like protein